MGLVFNQEDLAASRKNVVSIPARTAEAKEHGTIVVALKGRYLQNFARHRKEGATVDEIADIVEYCTTEPTTQTGFGAFE
jgi:hypothetical protein